MLISYRRGLPTSGDIDMLITHPTFTSETSQTESKSGGPGGNLLKTVVEVLETEGLITDTISHGGTKFMGVCQLQKDLPFRRLDIRIVPQDQVIRRDIFCCLQILFIINKSSSLGYLTRIMPHSYCFYSGPPLLTTDQHSFCCSLQPLCSCLQETKARISLNPR